MGNDMSQEEEMFLEEAYKMSSLDNPEVDKKVNSGTTAPAHQPKHTMESPSFGSADDAEDDESDDGFGSEVTDPNDGGGGHLKMSNGGGTGSNPQNRLPAKSMDITSQRRVSRRSPSDVERPSSSRQARPGSGRGREGGGTAAEREEARKLSYFQMAKLGYQELVNAIIRPPRADYKVRRCRRCLDLSLSSANTCILSTSH